MPRPHIGSDGQEPACRAEETGFNGGVGKIPLEEGMATKSGIVAQETHGQRSLVGYSPWGRKELDMTDTSFPVSVVSFSSLPLGPFCRPALLLMRGSPPSDTGWMDARDRPTRAQPPRSNPRPSQSFISPAPGDLAGGPSRELSRFPGRGR